MLEFLKFLLTNKDLPQLHTVHFDHCFKVQQALAFQSLEGKRNNKFIPQKAKLLFIELEETRNIMLWSSQTKLLLFMQDALVIINVGKKCSRITVFQLDKSMM
jgi:hypothetical protein